MAFIDLDSIHHYQPPRSTGRPLKRRSEARSTALPRGALEISSEHDGSVASAPKTKTSANLENYEPASCIDLTPPPPIETGDDLFGESALSFGGTENAQDTLTVTPYLAEGREENDGLFLSIEELLGDAGETQERQATNIGSESERANGAGECIDPNDRDGSSTSRPKGDGDEHKGTTDPGSVHPRGDGVVSDGQGEQHGAFGLPSTAASDSDARTINLQEKTDRPISGPTPKPSPVSLPPPPPPPPPPSHPLEAQPTDTDLSSMSEKQAEPGGGALEEIGSGLSSNGKEKADVDDGHDSDAPYRSRTARGARGVRTSSKRPADITDLNERGEGGLRSEKARRLGPIDATDNNSQEMSDLTFARLRALPQPVFRMPPSWRDFQQRENTASPNRSSETGSSQENPLMVGDDDNGENPGENGGSTRAISIESKLGPATLQGPPSPEKVETHARLSTYTPQPPTESVDRPISLSAALPQQPGIGVVGADDRGAVAVATPPSASSPPPAQPSPALAPAPVPALEEEEDEWEIRKIVDKRRGKMGYEYRVRWKDTWLLEGKLGNARRLLQEFQARRRAQRGSKPRKATRAGKAG